MSLTTMKDLPIEVLEMIFAMLPSVVDQLNLSLVCHRWRDIILNLRHVYGNSHKRRLQINTQNKSLQTYTFDRHVYIRLPVAGSLNDWGKNLI